MSNKLQLLYDLEVYPNFFLATFYDLTDGTFLEYELSDQLLNDVIRNPDLELVGFNNQHYDDTILNFIDQHSRAGEVTHNDGWGSAFAPPPSQELSTQTIFELSERIINGGGNVINDQQIKNAKYHDKAYSSIDLKSLLDPMPSLKKLELRMQFPNVQDLPIKPGTILTDQQKKDIRIYCRNDIAATEELFSKHSIKHLELRRFLAKRFNLPLSKLQSASEPRAAEYILSSLATANTGTSPWQIKENLAPIMQVKVAECIPDWIKFDSPMLDTLLSQLKVITLPTTGYAIGTALQRTIQIGERLYKMGIGGLHSADSPAYYQATPDGYNIIEPDVTSYYPSMLLRDGLHPRGYSRKWADTYGKIYEDRLGAKADSTRTTEAHALKIILNATFGKFGSQYSSFYDPTLLIRVTLGGQLALLMLIEALEGEDICVISANTDSVTVTPTNDQIDAYHRICKTWETKTKLNLEHTHYTRLAKRDVNNYTALTTNNKVKNKGIFTPPDIKHDVKAPVVQRIARQCLLYGSTIEEAFEEMRDELTIYDFLYSFGATKAFEIFIHPYTPAELKATTMRPSTIVGLSKTNRWYISNTSELRISKFGGKNQTWVSIPDAHHVVIANKITDDSIPDDLNLDYYKLKIKRLINDCGVTAS